MDRCAPNFANSSISCFDKEALLKIAQAYNQKNTDPIRIQSSNSKSEIWQAIQLKMSQKCGKDETCWLEQPFLRRNTKLEKYFKPLAPLGRYQWLSTDDIYKVMMQYSQKYPRFKFLGPLPMDFLKLHDPESKILQQLKLNLNNRKSDEIYQKYDQIGVIFNLDPSTKNGSHWVALNISLKKREIHYFDSYGDRHYQPNKFKLTYYDSNRKKYENQSKIAIPIEIQKLIARLLDLDNKQSTQYGGRQATKLYKKVPSGYKIKVNNIQHQYANSECGIYSMSFLIKCLHQPFEKITKDIVMDEKANQYRNILFRST